MNRQGKVADVAKPRRVMTIASKGATYHYHRRRGYPLIPLTGGVDPTDQVAVDADFSILSKDIEPDHPPSRTCRTKQLQHVVRKAVWRARDRAQVIGKPFDLTPAYVIGLLDAQNERCAVTGIHFRIEDRQGQRTTPYRPSIDRIDNNLGYVESNVQLVLLAVNLGKADFDLDTYLEVCRAIARAKVKTPLTQVINTPSDTI